MQRHVCHVALICAHAHVTTSQYNVPYALLVFWPAHHISLPASFKLCILSFLPLKLCIQTVGEITAGHEYRVAVYTVRPSPIWGSVLPAESACLELLWLQCLALLHRYLLLEVVRFILKCCTQFVQPKCFLNFCAKRCAGYTSKYGTIGCWTQQSTEVKPTSSAVLLCSEYIHGHVQSWT